MSDLLEDEVYTDVTEMIEDIEREDENESNTLEQDGTILSGNDINNYYYNKNVNIEYVSNNQIVEDTDFQEQEIETLSYNIIDKPINQYTVTESLILFSIVLGLFVLFILLVRRTVFKWK